MCDTVPENGCGFGKESDVWKLYVFAGGVAGAVAKQSLEIPKEEKFQIPKIWKGERRTNRKFQKLSVMFEQELEERCFQFAKRVRSFTRKLRRDVENIEDIRQLNRASGSVGANYIEANENVGPGDLKYRIKISRKESKESIHFLGLVEVFGDKVLEGERSVLIDEAGQLRKIFSAMLKKLENK